MSEQKFEPFQRVLARYCKTAPWIAVFYGHKTDLGHLCGTSYMEDCIPYEGNEHLLGKIGEPKSKWQPKPGELVAVSDDGKTWYAQVFVKYEKGEEIGEYVTSDTHNKSQPANWQYCETLRNHFSVPEE